MKKLSLFSLKILAIFICLFTINLAHARPTAAECDAGLSWSMSNMNFGTYIGGTSGTIMMDENGALTPIGVVLVGGGGAPLIFDFTNSVPDCDKAQITIKLPPNITINNAGSNVIINSLLTSISPKTKFKLSKTSQITIGGTLNANATDASGAYNGSNTFDFSY